MSKLNSAASMVIERGGSRVFVGLGANLGDPISQLISAKQALLAHPSVMSARSSSFYLSSPVGYDAQPDFVNSVLELSVASSYREFFSLLQRIEGDLGRQRDPNNQNAARLIDIDLLLFDHLSIAELDLVVPHPRMHERLFVLKPLQELDQQVAEALLNNNSTDFSGQELHRLKL